MATSEDDECILQGPCYCSSMLGSLILWSSHVQELLTSRLGLYGLGFRGLGLGFWV